MYAAPTGPDELLVAVLGGKRGLRADGESARAAYARMVTTAHPEVQIAADHPVQGAGPFWVRPSRVAGQGVFLLGDAAGFLDPLTGDGLSDGLVAAQQLARIIAAHEPGPERAYRRWEAGQWRRRVFVNRLALTLTGSSVLARRALRRLQQRPATLNRLLEINDGSQSLWSLSWRDWSALAGITCSLATALPEHRLEAREALEQLRKFFPQLDKLDGAEAGLGVRYTCEPVADLLTPRGLTDMSKSYLRHAKRLAVDSSRQALQEAGMSGHDIDLVISVSCTGYLVPSLDVHMAEELGLRPDVLRLPITELGCSAGAAAIAAAQRHLVGFPDHKVLVVAVEVPSLSFQRGDRSVVPIAAGALYPFTGWLLSPMLASVAMSLSSISVISNALRLRRVRL